MVLLSASADRPQRGQDSSEIARPVRLTNCAIIVDLDDDPVDRRERQDHSSGLGSAHRQMRREHQRNRWLFTALEGGVMDEPNPAVDLVGTVRAA